MQRWTMVVAIVIGLAGVAQADIPVDRSPCAYKKAGDRCVTADGSKGNCAERYYEPGIPRLACVPSKPEKDKNKSTARESVPVGMALGMAAIGAGLVLARRRHHPSA